MAVGRELRKIGAHVRRLVRGAARVRIDRKGDIHALGERRIPANSVIGATIEYDPGALREADLRFEAFGADGSVRFARKLSARAGLIKATFYSDDAETLRLRVRAAAARHPVRLDAKITVRKLRERPMARPALFTPPSRTVTLVTYPLRAGMCPDALESLIGQADQVMLYLNEYRQVPEFALRRERSNLHYVLDSGGRLRAAAKFHWAHEDGYHLLCDDDIIYPADYVERLVDAVEGYGRKAVAGVHAANFDPVIHDSHKRRETWNFALALAADMPVHLLGIGTVAFHSDTVRDFDWAEARRYPVSSDNWFAVQARMRGVPLVAVQRAEGWMRSHPNMDFGIHEEKQIEPFARAPETELMARHNPWPWPLALPETAPRGMQTAAATA